MSAVPVPATTKSENFDPDLTDLALFGDGPPHDTFRRLREEQPVHWNRPSPGGSSTGFWSVTRYDDIERGVFVMMDPPAHVKHRSIVQKVFTPRAVFAHEPEIRRVITELLDGVIDRGECDFFDDIPADGTFVSETSSHASSCG